MGKLISIGQKRPFKDEMTTESFSGPDDAISAFLHHIEEDRPYQAAVPLSWLIGVGVPTAKKMAENYRERTESNPAIKTELLNLPEVAISGSTNDFLMSVGRCFGLHGIEMLNAYIHWKKRADSRFEGSGLNQD